MFIKNLTLKKGLEFLLKPNQSPHNAQRLSSN